MILYAKLIIAYNSIKIEVKKLSDNCDKVNVECYVYISGNYIFHEMKTINPPGRTFPTAQSISFTGLTRNWQYRFLAYSMYDANGDGTGTGTWLESETSNIVIVSTLNRPYDWEWETNFTEVMEFDLFFGDGENYIIIMPAGEWNRFLSKIDEFRDYVGLTKLNKTYSSGREFNASLYNEAIGAINDMRNHFGSGFSSIPLKPVGYELGASDLHLLRDTLNSIT